jgi:SHS2 domain-containing protein
MSFEELPHTADILVRIKAETLEELFTESVRALMEVMYGGRRDGNDVHEIAIASHDPASLLVAFLSEVLFLSESDLFVVSACTVTMEDTSLRACLTGEKFDPERHSGGTEVKGISYSGIAIEKGSDGYQVDILFDV